MSLYNRMKKIVFILLTLGLFFTAALTLDFQRLSKGSGCAFCRQEVLDAQVFYRKGGAIGMLTYKPAVPGHVLIIPERHVERFEDLTSTELMALGDAIKEIDQMARKAFGHRDYLLIEKNGRGAGQSVPHLHFHYLPAAKFLAARFFLSPWLKPLKGEELALLRDAFIQEKAQLN